MHIHFVLFWGTFTLADTPSGVFRIVTHRVWGLLQMYAVSPCFIKMYEYKFYLKQSVFFSPISQYKHCESLFPACLPSHRSMCERQSNHSAHQTDRWWPDWNNTKRFIRFTLFCNNDRFLVVGCLAKEFSDYDSKVVVRWDLSACNISCFCVKSSSAMFFCKGSWISKACFIYTTVRLLY